MLNQLEVEKCTTDSVTSSNNELNGHQEQENPPPGPSVSTSPKTKSKEKRVKWSREDYKEMMHAFYYSLSKPSSNHTQNTYKLEGNSK